MDSFGGESEGQLRERFLGISLTMEPARAQALRDTFALLREGVLSEREYAMKKRELLEAAVYGDASAHPAPDLSDATDFDGVRSVWPMQISLPQLSQLLLIAIKRKRQVCPLTDRNRERERERDLEGAHARARTRSSREKVNTSNGSSRAGQHRYLRSSENREHPGGESPASRARRASATPREYSFFAESCWEEKFETKGGVCALEYYRDCVTLGPIVVVPSPVKPSSCPASLARRAAGIATDDLHLTLSPVATNVPNGSLDLRFDVDSYLGLVCTVSDLFVWRVLLKSHV